jgi:dephospho-CoA kinase
MPLTNRPFLFSITGGIASGKSLFSQLLQHLGFTIIDTDRIAHDVLDMPSIKKLLVIRWGEKIIKQDKLDRDAIASIVFDDPNQLLVLNQLTHPIIIKEMQKIIEQSVKPQLGFEVPLLFETGFHKYFDLNIMVTATTELRITRLMERGINREEALKRINSQMSDTDKSELADCIVMNDNDLKTMEKEAIKVFNLIRQSQKKEILSFSEYFTHN